MAQFIYRDYVTPVIVSHTNKVALKNIWRKLQPTTIVNGVDVLQQKVYFRGVQGSTGYPYYPTVGNNGIRNDVLFKKFLRTCGIKHTDLVNNSYKGTTNVYFYLNAKKAAFSAQTASAVSSKYNTDYLSKMYPVGVSSHPNYYFSCNGILDTVVARLPYDNNVERYKFLVSGLESSISEDGYFAISNQGVVTITQSGIDNEIQYFSFINSNSHSYTVKKVLKDLTYTTETINLNCQRDYIDIRITVGGQYQNRINAATLASNRWIIEDDPQAINPTIEDLATIRAAIEADPRSYLGNMVAPTFDRRIKGVSPINRLVTHKGVTTSNATLLSAVGDITYDEYNGHVYDVLSILDNGEIFNLDPTVYNEVVNIQPVGNFSDTAMAYTTAYNMEYSYVRRYRIKALSTDTSKVVTDSVEAGEWIASALNDPMNVLADTINRNKKSTAAEDTTMTSAIYMLHDTGISSAMFEDGYLKLSVFNALTPNQFAELVAKTLEVGYKTPKSKWYHKVLAVLIVVAAVAVFVLTGGSGGGLSAALMSAALSMAFLVVSQMLYAKYVGDPWGMKLIGGAITINGIALSAMAIASGYTDIQNILMALETDWTVLSPEVALQLGTSSVGTASSAVGLAGQLGIGVDEDISNMLTLLGAGLSSIASVRNLMQNGVQFGQQAGESLSQTAFRNVSGFVDNLGASARSYMAYESLMNGTDDMPYTKDQGEIESDGVERVYMLQEKVYDNDALSNMDTYMQQAHGLNKTEMILKKQMW